MKFVLISTLFLLVTGLVEATISPMVCISAPAVTLQPGSIVSASLQPSPGKRCEAVLTFADSDFFPLRVDFKPISCLGSQEAQFVVPLEVPNGEAFILWRCADQSSPSCTQAMISGGSGDQNALDISQSGVISCIIPVATQTTLVTSIGPSTTVTEALTSTIISTSILPTNVVSPAPLTTANAISGNSAASTSTLTSTSASDANAVSITSGASSNMVIGTNLVPTAMRSIMTALSQASANMTERQLSWRITETITALCTSS
ncbi:hypothetical protein LHYA1_G008585 [Lachnellula hyalina]|uniref:Uncharacterized protein n=1 Tax=Lachnellula hyalina TaxID=1316788 RepID=A0A8H8TYE5_9HELO|nr:uncharacterized protein LHYA1_G008585 [Lachnellula hyalina]TVY25300.1 hypothetical protein LHYA1_G008585 [Lachnellula hyalina]